MKLTDIHLRDPFLFTDHTQKRYLMTGTVVGSNLFPMYASKDLEQWEPLADAFEPDDSFFYNKEFWAPEIHEWKGLYYLFATFAKDHEYRATHILISNSAEGPYRPFTEMRATPPLWQCLDGSFYSENGVPWIVFGKEWLQCHDGGMWACRLSPDLSRPVGRPVWLFNGSESAWSQPQHRRNEQPGMAPWYDCYVCEAPWFHRLADGTLVTLWSGFSNGGYSVGLARSSNGSITSDWHPDTDPLWKGGGHAMLFKNLQGELMMSLHQPNNAPLERPAFLPIHEQNGTLIITTETAQAGGKA